MTAPQPIGGSEGDGATLAACPACEARVGADASRCPECHTDLTALRAVEGLADGFYNAALEHAAGGRGAEAEVSSAAALAAAPDDPAAWVLLESSTAGGTTSSTRGAAPPARLSSIPRAPRRRPYSRHASRSRDADGRSGSWPPSG